MPAPRFAGPTVIGGTVATATTSHTRMTGAAWQMVLEVMLITGGFREMDRANG